MPPDQSPDARPKKARQMTDPVRVLIPLDSQVPETVQFAFAYAKKIAESSPTPPDVVLLTHTKAQPGFMALDTVLGARGAKALAKGPTSLSWGGQLRSETLKTLKSSIVGPRPAIVIVYFADATILDFVDGLRNLLGVIVVPDHPGGADAWTARWGPAVHGQTHRAKPAPLINDPVVVRALENLSKMINLSTGLLNSRDKAYADEVLRILRTKGHGDPSDQIRSWAIRNGWRPDGAAALEALARKVWGLQRAPRIADYHNVEVRYARWRDGED